MNKLMIVMKTALLCAALVLPAAPSLAQRGSDEGMNLLLQQIQQLQTEVQALRALTEEQAFAIRRLQQESMARYTDMDQRLITLEGGEAVPPLDSEVGGSHDPASDPARDAVTGAPIRPTFTRSIINRGAEVDDGSSGAVSYAADNPLPAGRNAAVSPVTAPARRRDSDTGTGNLSEQQLYQMAYDSVIDSEFERSIVEFDQYLSIHPQGRFVTNAHYWKGQAFLYLERYRDAQAAYQLILREYPESSKVSAAMYGLALTYEALDDIDMARAQLNEIKRRFPNTGEANLADARLLALE